jgi:Domain of unknown function DUF29
MTQELIDLRKNILAGRYTEALELLDELDGMSRKAILRNIKSFLVRMLVHLIKNHIEQRLTNSWVASISDSLLQIQDLNLQDNKTAYYITVNEWNEMLEAAFSAAIRPASVEVLGGKLRPAQLAERVNKTEILAIAQQLLSLTYAHSPDKLPDLIDDSLAQLPGGENWQSGNL